MDPELIALNTTVDGFATHGSNFMGALLRALGYYRSMSRGCLCPARYCCLARNASSLGECEGVGYLGTMCPFPETPDIA